MHVDIGRHIFRATSSEDSTVDLLSPLCSHQLLNWLEVMSLLGDLGVRSARCVGAQDGHGEISRFFAQEQLMNILVGSLDTELASPRLKLAAF